MKIAPVGRERDIQIAELMGVKYITNCPLCSEGICYEEKDNNFFIRHELMWSTNRNDAWELESEFINSGLVSIMTIERQPNLEYIVFYTISEPHKTKHILSLVALNKDLDKAIADCVSQAWLTWKGDK